MDWIERDTQNKIIKLIYETLRRKGYDNMELTYGQVMDDYWVRVTGNGVFLEVERQFYQNDAFKAMLHEVENKL